MSHFLLKICIRQGIVRTLIQTPKLHLLRICYPSANSFSSSANDESFDVVSYLTNTCGFTLKSALSASKYIILHSAEKPDAVISFFKKYGWSQTEISSLVQKNPRVLAYNVENILSKLEFLVSRGASVRDVVAIVDRHPQILGRSLKDQIIPVYDFIRNLVRSDEKTRTALKRGSLIFNNDLDSNMAFNVSLLRDTGVPEPNIARLLLQQPQAMASLGKLARSIEQVKEMGFDPSKTTFLVALRAVIGMSKSTWEGKVNLYKKWGWTEEEVMGMFKKYPHCMSSSESKIKGLLGFFVEKLGWGPSVIGKYPGLFSVSLTKRVLPRDSIMQCLLSKGLIEKHSYSPGVFLCTEKQFLKRYVNCHEDSPQLLALYNRKISQATGCSIARKIM